MCENKVGKWKIAMSNHHQNALAKHNTSFPRLADVPTNWWDLYELQSTTTVVYNNIQYA